MTFVIYTRWKDMRHENVVIDRKGRDLKVTILIDDYTYIIHTGDNIIWWKQGEKSSISTSSGLNLFMVWQVKTIY